ncbi:FadD7 family fatty acid--CoA ligase [Mycolicibacterium palauense]|uniref:FadD7 family fatty acid--CoA ligase n=1 Tax=Mycolicibacterium palauense TaxID=2034511 RepID=UPI000BFF13FD|nr:FadD7 family fatty acid--CoA ligase [Mycolicibacterium palauense]
MTNPTPPHTVPAGLLATLADREAAARPDAPALLLPGPAGRVSYRQLARAVADTADTLGGYGLSPGAVVGLRCANGAEFVIGLLAAARAGLVTAPLDPALQPAEQQHRMQRLGAQAILTDVPGHPGDCPELVLGLRTPDRGCTLTGDRPRPAAPVAGLTAADALVMFTSGTTGLPKLVPWTHDNIAASVAAVAQTYDLGPGDATVAVMPMFHGHGLIAGLLATLVTGGCVGLPAKGRFSPSTFLGDALAVGATWYTAAPTIHQILLETLPAGDPLPALRFLRSCSAPLPPAVAERLEERWQAPVLPAYGMTEATHQACGVTPSSDTEVRRHTVGVPTGTRVRIVGEDGADCPAGTTGEVWVYGPGVVRGYLGNEAATAATFVDGWLRTGDLGALGPDGALRLRGRIKNVINRGGEKLSPEHIEDVLLACPGVVQAAAFGIPDEIYGEQVAAAVVLGDGERFDADALLQFCGRRLAKYEVPVRITRVDALPLTPKGAVDRNRLAAAIPR